MSQLCEHRNGKSNSCNRVALIGVGANLPGPAGEAPLMTCRRAVSALDNLPGMRLKGLSRWFESAPVPPSGQPPYINAIALLSIDPGLPLDPAELLRNLQAIESRHGRQRSVPDAARTLDLDLIALGSCIRAAPDPVLPHPRAHLRAFVLAPLAEVAPDWIHPVLGRNAASLLTDLPPQHIRPLPV